MFIRTKTSPHSPNKSVQIVQSIRVGKKVKQTILRHIGTALDDEELKQLKVLAQTILLKLKAGNQKILFGPEDLSKANQRVEKKEDEKDYEVNLKDIIEEQRVISGIHDIYGTLFEELGYSKVIENPNRHKSTVEMFKNIVLARIANPDSKRGSVDKLEQDFGIKLNLDRVYKMMDKLDDTAIDKLNNITYLNTKQLFDGKIDVVFFDCTTVYFESFEEDEFRKNGYSKDLKFNQPQVLIALMVTKQGLPVAYEAFEGDTYEGHTVVPAIKRLKEKYDIDKIVFVADSGMFNSNNIKELEDNKLEYIVGSRLKNTSQILQKQILDHANYETINEEYKIGQFKNNDKTLIVSYSAKRARKDKHDREKAIERIKNKLDKQKNPKEYLSNYGYKKYLKVTGTASISIDKEKIEQASKWDGLHGVITNATDLSNEEVLKQYTNLWVVENAFRVTKHDIKVRPVYHWKPERVKAHLAICFTAYALIRHLEYRVRLQYESLSPEKIKQELIRIQTSIIYNKKKKIRYGLPSKVSLHSAKIYRIFNLKRDTTPYIIKKL